MASHRKLCETTRTKWDAASAAFNKWAIANGYGHVRSNDLESAIKEPAGLTLLAVERIAHQALTDAENAAVHAGHAWRGTFSLVYFYSPAEIRKWSRQRNRGK